MGRLYEQHGGKRGRLDLGLPRMQLDGPMLREIRKRIRKRHGPGAGSWLKLSMQDGVLRIGIDGAVYAMRAQGAIGVDCEVSLADFIGIPPGRLRGRAVTMERGAGGLSIGWYSMAIKALPELQQACGPSIDAPLEPPALRAKPDDEDESPEST